MQFRDDPRFQESWLKQPDEDMERRYPVFCLRFALARLVHRFTKLGVEAIPTSESHIANLNGLHDQILQLKETMPLEWRPGHDIFAEPELYRAIMLMHLEYHAVVLAVYASLSVIPTLQPSKLCTTSSAQLKRQITGRVTSARIVLQTLKTIATTQSLGRGLVSW
jgi:hypothetical protein